MKRRVLNLLIALDQLVYVLLTLGEGSPDETLSAAAWRVEKKGRLAGQWLRPLIDWLFLPWGRDHCRLSYLAEAQRLHSPSEYRACGMDAASHLPENQSK